MECTKMKYYKLKRPKGDTTCGHKHNKTVKIPRGTGYMYINEAFVKMPPSEIKRITHETLAYVVLDPEWSYPLLLCESCAKKEGLDLEVALSDAEYWWKKGKVPLRPTPKIKITIKK